MDSLINQLFIIPLWLLHLTIGLVILIIALFISTRYVTKQDLKENIFLTTALLTVPLIINYALMICTQNDIASKPWKYLHITRNGPNLDIKSDSEFVRDISVRIITEGELIYVVEYQDRQYDIHKTLTE